MMNGYLSDHFATVGINDEASSKIIPVHCVIDLLYQALINFLCTWYQLMHVKMIHLK